MDPVTKLLKEALHDLGERQNNELKLLNEKLNRQQNSIEKLQEENQILRSLLEKLLENLD